MTRTILDLAKPKTTVFDLSNVLNPRVNDDLAKISFHIQYDNKPFNMTGYKMYFISADENMGYINIDGMVDKIEIGDNVGNGDVTFKFPPNVFKKAGTFDSAKTMFAIENINSNYIQSTINISLTVLENGVAKFNADVDQIGYDSKLEEIHNEYKNKAQNLIDELINQVKAVDNFSNVKETAEQAKQVANDSIAKVNEVNNEVTTARSRFSNLNDRLNNQDIKINAAETTTNANANYNRLTEKDLSQDIAIATKADKDEIDNRLKLYSESLKNTDSVARQAHDVAYNADSRSVANSSRLDKLVTPPKSDSSTEVTDARVGATSLGGVTYQNLGNSIRGQIDTLNGKVISADMIKLNALNIKPYASYGREISAYDTSTKKPILKEKADTISVDMSVSEMPAKISFKASNSAQKIIFYKANSKATNISNSNETTFQQSYGLYECHNGYFTIKTDSFTLNGFDRVAFNLDVMYQEVLDVSADVDEKTLLDWYKKRGQIDSLNGNVISADMIKLNALNIKPYAAYGKEIVAYDTGTKKPVLRKKADTISVDMSVSEMPARISFKASNSTQKIIFYKANSKATNISNSNETTFQQSYGLYECHNGYFTIKTDSFALNGFDRVAFNLDVMYQEVLDASNGSDSETLLDWYKKTRSFYNVSLSMFSNFGVLGDSYSVGTLYRDGTWKSVFKLQWPQLIARKWGITAKTFSKGGLSTRTWLTDDVGLKALKSSDVQDLYCICLGINDAAILSKEPSYLGTTDNIGDNSDTFYGNYSRIVSEVKAKAPHSKIICFGLSQTVDNYPQITNAIGNIAKAYNVPFVDLLSNDFFKSNWYNSMLNGHPVGPVYGGMATAYESLIQNAIQNNSDYFADYAFY